MKGNPVDSGESISAHPWVRNGIIAALAVPPLIVLWGGAVSAVLLAYRTAQYGSVPDLSGVAAGVLSNDLALLAVAAAVAYLYLIWANAVFGSETVETATEQAQDIRDEVDDET